LAAAAEGQPTASSRPEQNADHDCEIGGTLLAVLQ